MIEHIIGPLSYNYLKTVGPRMNDAVIHATHLHLMTVMKPGELKMNFPIPKFGSCEFSQNHSNEIVLYMFRGYSNVILNQHQSEYKLVVSTVVDFRNYEETTAQFEICTVIP